MFIRALLLRLACSPSMREELRSLDRMDSTTPDVTITGRKKMARYRVRPKIFWLSSTPMSRLNSTMRGTVYNRLTSAPPRAVRNSGSPVNMVRKWRSPSKLV